MPYATYRFNKIIAAETIRFIVTVAIVVYKGLKLVVYRMLTNVWNHNSVPLTPPGDCAPAVTTPAPNRSSISCFIACVIKVNDGKGYRPFQWIVSAEEVR